MALNKHSATEKLGVEGCPMVVLEAAKAHYSLFRLGFGEWQVEAADGRNSSRTP
jgi:hypothetical protein